MMEPYDVYRSYLALRLHFTTEKYDVIKNRGRVKASKQAFFKRRDLFAIRKISDSYSEKEVVDFLVANFVSGDRWGGVFDSQSKERFTEWKKRIESLSYLFESECRSLQDTCDKHGIDFEKIFAVQNGQHPYILKAFLRKQISIETLVILNVLLDYCTELDEKLAEDIVWPNVSILIKKYRPFLKFDKEKYERILSRATR